jgi:peptide/nickel transport system permease protein
MMRRMLGATIATVVGLAVAMVAVEVLVAAAPGDAIDLLPNASDVRSELARQWGLDQPLPARVVARIGATLTGDLGTSWAVRPGAPVAELLPGPWTRSVGWWAAALIGGIFAAFVLRSAPPRVRRPAVVLSALSVLPVFLLGFAAWSMVNDALFAAIEAGWMARPSWFPVADGPGVARFLFAASTLAIGSAAWLDLDGDARLATEAFDRAGFVEAARLRGEPTAAVRWRHLTLAALGVAAARGPALLGSLVVLEMVLRLDGVGRLLWDAAANRDAPVAAGSALALAATVAALRWLVEIGRSMLDPREVTR